MRRLSLAILCSIFLGELSAYADPKPTAYPYVECFAIKLGRTANLKDVQVAGSWQYMAVGDGENIGQAKKRCQREINKIVNDDLRKTCRAESGRNCVGPYIYYRGSHSGGKKPNCNPKTEVVAQKDLFGYGYVAFKWMVLPSPDNRVYTAAWGGSFTPLRLRENPPRPKGLNEEAQKKAERTLKSILGSSYDRNRVEDASDETEAQVKGWICKPNPNCPPGAGRARVGKRILFVDNDGQVCNPLPEDPDPIATSTPFPVETETPVVTPIPLRTPGV